MPRVDRRRALQTLFCASASLALNINPRPAAADVQPDAIHLLALGDWGAQSSGQKAVAQAMRSFRRKHSLTLAGMLFLGDNFYSKVKDGFTVDSPRWHDGFEAMYPAEDFSCPCHAVLGNHDYGDNPGGEEVQLAYARRPSTRWNMPGKHYRLDIGVADQGLTILALDSNLARYCDKGAEQLQWLKDELAKPRHKFTVVMAHHPIYSDGKHGDTPALAPWAQVLNEHKVHAYLCGHDHDLQHLELENQFPSYVLSGAGGAGLRPLQGKRPTAFGRNVHGFTHLQIGADSLVFSHHDTEGNLLHRFIKRSTGAVEIACL